MLSKTLQNSNKLSKSDGMPPQYGPKCKNVINSLWSKSRFSSSSEMSFLKHPRKLHMKDYIIKFGESVANHGLFVVKGIYTMTQFVNHVNNTV